MLFYQPITSLKLLYNTERHQVLTELTVDWRSYAAYTTSARNWRTWEEIKSHFIHYCDVVMATMSSQILSIAIVYSTAHSGGDQRKYQSSASLAFVRGINMWPVNSPHKGSVTRKMFPFDDVIMIMPGNPLSNMILITPYSFRPKRIWHYVSLSICSS